MSPPERQPSRAAADAARDLETPRGTALVTGAAGFLGRHLVAELLRRGRRVIALDLNLAPLEHHLAEKNLAPSQPPEHHLAEKNLAPSAGAPPEPPAQQPTDKNLAPAKSPAQQSSGKNLAPSAAHLERQRLQLLAGDIAEAETRRRALKPGPWECGEQAPVETVFHLAAAHLGARIPEAEFQRVNVEATTALAREALAAGIRRFVHTSSVGVYGELVDPPADETSPCRPDLPYERTKLEGERQIAELARAGLPAVILRPVWIYGPDCPRTIRLLRAIARRRFVVAGKGETMRHCLHIDDMVTAFLLAEQSPMALGQIMVVGDEKPVPLGELFDTIAHLTGAPPPPRVPYPLLWLAAVTAELFFYPIRREPPLSRRTLKLFTNNTAFRTDRARRLLGFHPRHTLRGGLEACWRSLSP